MLKITALELENFQSIGDKTLIPIRQLTMLFGPNGAGKSTVFDALELLELICSNDWGVSNKKLIDYLNRWSRNSNINEPTNQLGIGVYLEFPDDLNTRHGMVEYLAEIQGFSKIDSDEFDFTLEESDGEGDNTARKILKTLHLYIKFEKGGDWFLKNLTIDYASRKVVEVSAHSEESTLITIHNSPFISFENIEDYKGKSNEGNEECIGVGKDSIYGVVDVYPIFYLMVGRGGKAFRELFGFKDPDKVGTHHFQQVFEQTFSFFSLIIHKQFLNSSNLPLVKASRNIPSMHETISLVDDKYNDFYERVILSKSPLLERLANELNGQEQHWIYLCGIVADACISTAEPLDGAWSNLSELDKLNSLLRDELFLENGYLLVGEVSCLVGINKLQGESIKISADNAKLVRLYLKDAHQRSLEIEDVGSGIGYVLPVLAALVSDGCALIQQPELHLHPAMQSALGEAIVKAVENKKLSFQSFTILETHSEHLLLRVMRLLKTSKERDVTKEALCPLTYENVSILYFDPKPDGSTQVKRLRLAPDGSFVDRWPRGFFTERYDDLFYE